MPVAIRSADQQVAAHGVGLLEEGHGRDAGGALAEGRDLGAVEEGNGLEHPVARQTLADRLESALDGSPSPATGGI